MRIKGLTIALALAIGITPAQAGNKLVPPGVKVQVAKSTLAVTPLGEWNRMGARPGRHSETWTLDGPALNDLTFYGGIADGRTLFREVDKHNRPLPRFSATMLPTDIPQLLENSYRIALNTPQIEVTAIEPARFAGRPGVRFTYGFSQGDDVRRRGEALGAVIGGKLYLVTFEAPVILFFDRDVAAARSMMAGAALD